MRSFGPESVAGMPKGLNGNRCVNEAIFIFPNLRASKERTVSAPGLRLARSEMSNKNRRRCGRPELIEARLLLFFFITLAVLGQRVMVDKDRRH